jgi:hypothetical protein
MESKYLKVCLYNKYNFKSKKGHLELIQKQTDRKAQARLVNGCGITPAILQAMKS